MNHDQLMAAARQALEDLFADSSVPLWQTRAELKAIIGEIDDMIESTGNPD